MNFNKILSVVWDYFLITVGALIYCLAWTSFLQPNELASGGLTGLCTIVQYATNGVVPIGLTFPIINAFLLIMAFLILGKSFGFKTIYVIGLSSLLFAVLPRFNGVEFPLNLEVLMDNKLMVCIVGAFLESVGIGMVLLRGGSTGGTDIVAMIINKYWPLSPGKVYLYSDIFIVASLLFLPVSQGGGVENMIYAYVVMIGFSFGVDYVLLGGKSSVQLLVFSPQYQQIADHIIYDVQRGVTALQSIGWYSQKESKVLLIILRKQQMNEVIKEIKRIDKNAFISVSTANSVYGEGFEEIKTGIDIKKKLKEKNQA
ncbi:MAG: YitT family protein [Bacteroidales bacterium]|nr:YitT family protein [Bacteroidales bacterium]